MFSEKSKKLPVKILRKNPGARSKKMEKTPGCPPTPELKYGCVCQIGVKKNLFWRKMKGFKGKNTVIQDLNGFLFNFLHYIRKRNV